MLLETFYIFYNKKTKVIADIVFSSGKLLHSKNSDDSTMYVFHTYPENAYNSIEVQPGGVLERVIHSGKKKLKVISPPTRPFWSISGSHAFMQVKSVSY